MSNSYWSRSLSSFESLGTILFHFKPRMIDEKSLFKGAVACSKGWSPLRGGQKVGFYTGIIIIIIIIIIPYFLLQRSIGLPFFSFGKTRKLKRASSPLLYSFGWKINHTNPQKRTL